MKKKRQNKQASVQIIKKSNDLIEARYRFDIWETRMFLTVLSCIRREDEDFQVYRIRYKDIINLFKLSSHQSYDLLRDAAKSLMGRTFKVNSKVDGFERTKEYHIIRTVDYLEEGQEGEGIENQEYLDITIEPEMKPLLMKLHQNFTAYNLRHVVKLGSQSVRLYELLKQYQVIGSRRLEIEGLRRMLGYEKEYVLFSDFYRYFVQVAIKEINKNTDLIIYEVKKEKEGRRVSALQFFFRLKDETEERLIEEPIEVFTPNFEQTLHESKLESNPKREISLVDQLFNTHQPVVVQKFGVTPTVFFELLHQYDASQIEQAIRVTHHAIFNQQIKSNTAGFFIEALKKGFTDAKIEAQKRAAAAVSAAQTMESELENLYTTYVAALNDKIRGLVEENPQLTTKVIDLIRTNPLMHLIIAEKEAEQGRPLELDDYRQNKVLRELVKSKIVEMNRAHFEELQLEYENQKRKIQEKY